MATLIEVLDAVSAESTKIDSLLVLVAGLKEQIKGIGNLTVEQQAQVDAIFAAVAADSAEVQAALDENVA